MGDILNISTLLVVGLLGGIVAGTALGFLWLLDRRNRAFGVWAISFWFGALACALFIASAVLPDWTAILMGNAILALGYGLIWLGFQVFDGRRASLWKAAIGAVSWVPFLAVPLLHDEPQMHAALAGLVMAGYSLAVGWRLTQRRRFEPLPARLPTGVLMYVHGMLYLLLGPLVLLTPGWVTDEGFRQSPLFVAGVLEALVFSLLLIVAMLTLSGQRDAHRHRRAAETDALTGLPNRAAFFRKAEALLSGGGCSGVLMVFDLDHFRLVNDRFGRAEGDRALQAFAHVLRREVQPPDIVARVGDEEFALFMPSIRLDVGQTVAEYLCRQTAALRLTTLNGEAYPITTSVGLASVADVGADLEALVMAADVALVEAKRVGRNRARAYRAAHDLPAAG
jgi:diguanylate cyclase (GGDEF)-like protein